MLHNWILAQKPNPYIYDYPSEKYGSDTINEPDGIPNPEILIVLAIIIISAIMVLFKVN